MKIVNYIIVVLILTTILIQNASIALAQDIQKHQLQLSVPANWQNTFNSLNTNKEFKFINEITNPNTTEKLEILYSPNQAYQQNMLDFYKELDSKNLLIPQDPKVPYDLDGKTTDRVTFNVSENRFLKCVNSNYKKLNNDWYSIKWGDNVYFVKSKEIELNYTKHSGIINTGVFLLQLKPSYNICRYQTSYITFRDNSVKDTFYNDYYENEYFSTGRYGDDHIMIKAKLTDEYDKSFLTGDMNNNYDKIINQISSSDWEEYKDVRTPQQLVTEAYDSITSNVELHKHCLGDITVTKSQLKTPELLNLQNGILKLNSIQKSDKLSYKIWYDICDNYIFKTETKYKEGILDISNSNIYIKEKSASLFDKLNNTIKDNNSNPIEVNIQGYSKGLRYYAINQAIGNTKINLEKYGDQDFKYDITSNESPHKFEKEYSFGGVWNTLSTSFMQGLYNIPKSLVSTLGYYSSKDGRTTERDIATTSGIVASGIGVALLAGISFPFALPAIVGLGVISLGLGLAMNSEGHVTGDLGNNVQNNFISTACGEGGSEYNPRSNTTEIIDPIYCAGNIGSLGAAAIITTKVQNKITTKINKQINTNHTTSPDYQKNIKSGLIPNEEGKFLPKPEGKQLVNPKAIKPLANILEDDLNTIKASIGRGITKVDQIDNLSTNIKTILKEFEEAGTNLFGCSLVVTTNNPNLNLSSILPLFIINSQAQSPACSTRRIIEDLVEYEINNAKLIFNDKFTEPKVELLYNDYQSRYTTRNKPIRTRLDWKRMYDHFMIDGPTARGNKFNKTAKESRWYRFDEIYLENKKRLDGYDLPKIDDSTKQVLTKGKIVSRKAIDLDIINEKIFKQYLNEFKTKYQVGTVIKTQKDGYELIFNKKLEGEFILEIPESNKTSANLAEFTRIANDSYVKIEFKPE